ncbi:MAG: OsmC family peroxiredoxin [Acidobacteria bacterium]|jgi:osmotically inducible protein OsmC|nr:OsmC family peroxiredoxin [Acidobacteriota bacterium]
MTFSRTTTVNWQGSIMEGTGTLTAGTGAFETKVTFPRRIGEPEGSTSPEELLAGSHAVCFAMVVTGAIGRASASTTSTTVTCTVTADKGDAGINLTKSELHVVADGLTGIDAAAFDALVQDAKMKCPISKALNPSIAITVTTEAK